MKFKIKCRFTNKVLFECDAFSLASAVNKAITMGANLSSANFSSADLHSADLHSADLSSANFREANLSYADFRYADLRCADFIYSDLRYADLRFANFRYADFRYADLRCADFIYSDLRLADFSRAKEDFFTKLLKAKDEAIGLYKALIDGKIDGFLYEGGFTKVKEINYLQMGNAINTESPAEVWFNSIKKGDTPDNNPVSALTKEWMEEFFKANDINPPKRQVSWVESEDNK